MKISNFRRPTSAALVRFAVGEAGTTAAEFALVIPIFLVLTIGTINIGMLMYAAGALHYATEDAARCAAVRTAICPDADATQTYALDRYLGPGPAPTFVATMSASCSAVSASSDYRFVTGLASFPIPLQASSCYPLQPS